MNIASWATQYRRLSVVSQFSAIAFIFLHQFFRVSLADDFIVVGMGTDPEPLHAAIDVMPQRAVAIAHPN